MADHWLGELTKREKSSRYGAAEFGGGLLAGVEALADGMISGGAGADMGPCASSSSCCF